MQTGIFVEKDYWEIIKEVAKSELRTISSLCILALNDYFQKNHPKEYQKITKLKRK